MRAPIPLLMLLLPIAQIAGCGAPESDVISLPEPHITVIGHDGQKASIRSVDLIDGQTGQPTVRRVLVVDRQTNRQLFVDVERLLADPPSGGRYILVTDNAPAAAGTGTSSAEQE